MKRVHPEFSAGIVSKFEADDMDGAVEASMGAVWYWIETIITEIGGQDRAEIPFIVAAMKEIIRALEHATPGAEEVADNLIEAIEVREEMEG